MAIGIPFNLLKLLPFTPETMTFARFLVISNRSEKLIQNRSVCGIKCRRENVG